MNFDLQSVYNFLFTFLIRTISSWLLNMCTAGGEDSCEGDSGGPLVVQVYRVICSCEGDSGGPLEVQVYRVIAVRGIVVDL